MLVLGTCNPAGEGSLYNGLYLKQNELHDLVASRAMVGVPVKAEHSGQEVGSVVSTFLRDDGALQCIMNVPEDSVRSSLAGGFVRDGIAAELSLGYVVDVAHSDQDRSRLKAGAKKVLEVSLVRKGARKGCHIVAYQEEGKNMVMVKPKAPDLADWKSFDLR